MWSIIDQELYSKMAKFSKALMLEVEEVEALILHGLVVNFEE